jgi:hypothetical protein
MNPNDGIRTVMLRYFYDRNASAHRALGIDRGVAGSLENVQSELEKTSQLSKEQVTSNLTYLVDRGWVKALERKAMHPDRTSGHGSMTETIRTYYQISALGIDKIEGESEFRVKDRFEGVNINTIGSVITVGDGNVVNTSFSQLHYELDRLKQTLTSSNLSEEEKLDVTADIESLKDQLAKRTPNKTVIRSLWSAIESVATVAGFVDVVSKVYPLVAALLSKPW